MYDASPKEDDRRDKTVKPDEESEQVHVNTNVHVTSSSSNLHAGTGSLAALKTARVVLRGERVAKVRKESHERRKATAYCLTIMQIAQVE